MPRRLLSISALASILLAGPFAVPALALNEADRLWLVGERAFADGLHPLARRALERFVVEYPNDTRIAPAMLILGRTRLVLGEPEKALEVLGRMRAVAQLPAQQLEGRFWEAEALYRLKQYAAARSAYDDVIGKDATSPLAPEALFGLGLCDLELRRPEGAIKAFRDLLTSWPDHAQAGPATFYLAQTLVEQKKYSESLYDAGVIAGKAGQVKDQQVAWGRLRKEFPHHPLAYQAAYDLAETAFKKKEWTQAAAQAKAAAASDEETLRARALLLEGESELKLSRFRDAAKSFAAVGSATNP